MGNANWNKTYGGTGLDAARSVVQSVKGGYALLGNTQSYGAGGPDFWLIKTSSNWSSNTDINNDKIINVLDLRILGKSYGKTTK